MKQILFLVLHLSLIAFIGCSQASKYKEISFDLPCKQNTYQTFVNLSLGSEGFLKEGEKATVKFAKSSDNLLIGNHVDDSQIHGTYEWRDNKLFVKMYFPKDSEIKGDDIQKAFTGVISTLDFFGGSGDDSK